MSSAPCQIVANLRKSLQALQILARGAANSKGSKGISGGAAGEEQRAAWGASEGRNGAAKGQADGAI